MAATAPAQAPGVKLWMARSETLPIRDLSSASAANSWMAVARALGSPGRTTLPFSPSRTSSPTAPGAEVAMIGRPQAMASLITIPQGSEREGNTKTSA